MTPTNVTPPPENPAPEPGQWILEQIARGEGDSTPWDELEKDWGWIRRDPLLAIRKAHHRELRMGTW